MPTYDFKCRKCGVVFEQLVPASVTVMPCGRCPAMELIQSGITGQRVSIPRLADRQLSSPAGIRMGDGRLRRKAQRIKEPTWVYPDGHRESLNSANTRPEE